MDTNQVELQIKVDFSSSCQDMLKNLRHRNAFLLIIFIIITIIIIFIIIIIITIVFYSASVKIHINDKSNLKSQSLRLGLFTPN